MAKPLAVLPLHNTNVRNRTVEALEDGPKTIAQIQDFAAVELAAWRVSQVLNTLRIEGKVTVNSGTGVYTLV